MKIWQKSVAALVWVALTFLRSECALSESVDLHDSIEKKMRVINQLHNALHRTKQAGRVYYRADCVPEEVRPNIFPQAIRFPDLELKDYPLGHDGVRSVHDIFDRNRGITTVEDSANIVRIRINHPSGEILKTLIPVLAFTHDQQYDARQAIGAIFHAKEVTAELERLNMQPILRAEDYISAYPHEGAPHLRPSLRRVTVDQALDAVAITFHGIIAYGSCMQPRVFDVEFF
ncbi:MAG: hypothetical protein WDM89_22480 [Rhizomicrobium sp.]